MKIGVCVGVGVGGLFFKNLGFFSKIWVCVGVGAWFTLAGGDHQRMVSRLFSRPRGGLI